MAIREDLREPIRKRAGLYIGDTGALGLFHMHEYVLTNFLDAKPSFVRFERRGNETKVTSDAVLPGAQVTALFDSGLVTNDGDEWTLLVANVLSSEFRFDSVSADGWFAWCGCRGVRTPTTHAQSTEFGTAISFTPDTEIFAGLKVSSSRFVARCLELSSLCPGVRFEFDDFSGDALRVCRPRGLAELLEAEGARVELDVTVKWRDVTARIAIGTAGVGGATVHSFVNRVRTRGGGHVQALQDLIASRPGFFRGHSGAISLEMPRTELSFEGPTREVLRIEGLRDGLIDAFRRLS